MSVRALFGSDAMGEFGRRRPIAAPSCDRHNGHMSRQFSAACECNREPILAVLRDAYADCRRVLETR